MKRILIPFTILISTIVAFSSCLSSDDNEVTYYDDSAISSFTLGTLNRTMHTLSSKGVDSVYQTTIAGSSYQFYIDQDKREIYNPDSLPYGTDVKHVICTVIAKNNGLIGIKSLVSDSVFSYSSTDSIDFSTPRQMVAIANSGKATRYYTVRVNVHQEEADVFNWADMGKQEYFSSLNGMKAVACGSQLFTFGQKDGKLVGYVTDNTNGKTDPSQPNEGLYPIVFDAVVVNVADATQNVGTETTVSTPSITVYQNGDVVDNGITYVAGGVTVKAYEGATDVTGTAAWSYVELTGAFDYTSDYEKLGAAGAATTWTPGALTTVTASKTYVIKAVTATGTAYFVLVVSAAEAGPANS